MRGGIQTSLHYMRTREPRDEDGRTEKSPSIDLSAFAMRSSEHSGRWLSSGVRYNHRPHIRANNFAVEELSLFAIPAFNDWRRPKR